MCTQGNTRISEYVRKVLWQEMTLLPSSSCYANHVHIGSPTLKIICLRQYSIPPCPTSQSDFLTILHFVFSRHHHLVLIVVCNQTVASHRIPHCICSINVNVIDLYFIIKATSKRIFRKTVTLYFICLFSLFKKSQAKQSKKTSQQPLF